MSPKPSPHPEPVDVFFPEDLMQAEVVKGVLESSGIPAMIVSESITSEGVTVGVPQVFEAGLRIRVPGDKVHEAKRVLAAARQVGRQMPGGSEGDRG